MSLIDHLTHRSAVISQMAREIHKCSVEKGFWPAGELEKIMRNDGECIALIHSELSECLEAIRSGNLPDKYCPEFSGAEIELADAVIRILDFCEARCYRIGDAVNAKMQFNETRPHKHGKAF